MVFMKSDTHNINLINVIQFILANLVIAFLVVLAFFNSAFNSPRTFLISIIWAFTISATQWIGPFMIIQALDKKINWLQFPLKRTLVQLISLLLWSIMAFVLVQTVMYYFVLDVPPAKLWPSQLRAVIYALFISLFISLVFTSIGFFNSWRSSLIKEAELKTEMMSYKYESLRNQLNPHFLFNSLNVLSDLVYTDQKQAVSFIRQLGDLFHYVLDSRDKELVSLDEELRFMDSYIFLLKTRFGEKLKLDIHSGANRQALIVPMTLQLLIENAVKHNEISEKYPLEIKVDITGDYIMVENKQRPKLSGEPSSSTGLKNIKQQYSFFTDKEVKVDASNGVFIVQIPLLYGDEK